MADALHLDRVTKRYGQDPPVIADVTHDFTPGSVTGLVGPNGSGKTTLLRLLSVTAYPTQGTVRYGELDVHDHPYRYLRHIGMVHAEAELPAHLSAVELLTWVLRSRDRWDAEGPARINELLDALDLDERRDNLIGTYSSGMLQKTQIAAALVARPEVLLMDEPLRSLDAASSDAAIDLIRAFKAEGGLVVIASHLSDALQQVVDDTIALGKAAETASPA
jgi:ABC-2 type transport system ATP-binding protein